ncbi:MAG: ribonuclease BN (tRNA processing enzyme) [Rhodothermales bacterium]|jgi:ribonuclease BN (tRNA processing enzyme)
MITRELSKDESFSLTNDGNLQLFFLGVGSAFASRHFQLNFLLVQGEHHIMVDFGMTGPAALRQVARLQPTDIEVLLPTHSHADHVGGIECLALMNRYVGMRQMNKRKLRMIIDENYQRVLWDYSLRGGLEWNEKDDRTAQKLGFSDFFEVVRPTWKTMQPRETYEVQLGPTHLEIFRTSHIPEQSRTWEASFISYGMFVNGHVFISCDTKYDRPLIDQYAPMSSVMFHDVQFHSGSVHAPLSDLRSLSPAIKSKMHLMHYSDDWEQQDIADFAGWAQQGLVYEFD